MISYNNLMEVSFSQTLSFDAATFEFDVVNNQNGNATAIKFQVDDKQVSPGDSIVVVSDGEILFHAMIGKIEDGFAYAADPKGSLLPAGIQ